MKTKYLITLVLILLTGKAFSKSDEIIDNDSLLTYYLQHTPPNVDTNTDALILYKKETTTLANWGALDYLKQFNVSESKCYKILTKEALALAEIAIPYSSSLAAKHVQIYVCYMENGKLVKDRITKSDAIKEKLVDGVKVFKFNISELKVGRILYYSYGYNAGISVSRLDDFLHLRFPFEEKYPVMEAHYEFSTINSLSYKAKAMNITFDTIQTENNNRSANTVLAQHKGKEDILKWSAYNIKKMEEEDYVKDFDSKIKAVEILVDCGRTREDKKFLFGTWKDGIKKSTFDYSTYIDLALENEDSFKNAPTLKKMDSIFKLPNHTFDDSLSIAKAVYAFVRDSVKTVYNKKGIRNILAYRTILEERMGTVYEKNALLTCIYLRMGFKCRNVILSTNEKLDINEFNPTSLNYMISALLIGKNYYLLDPGYKYLPFGVLAPKCYNGLSFVLNGESTPYDISPHSYNDKLTVSYTLTPKDSANDYQVKLEKRYGKESASTERAYIHKDSVEYRTELKDYITNLKYNFTLQDYNVKNENYVDSQLIISYNLGLKMDEATPFTYFNPFIMKIRSANPFKDVQRKYPVEFDLSPATTYLFKITLPPNTQLEEYPESKAINYKDKALSYEQSSTYDEKNHTFFLSYSFKINVFEIPVSEYTALRNYFESILTEQSKQIVLKSNPK